MENNNSKQLDYLRTSKADAPTPFTLTAEFDSIAAIIRQLETKRRYRDASSKHFDRTVLSLAKAIWSLAEKIENTEMSAATSTTIKVGSRA